MPRCHPPARAFAAAAIAVLLAGLLLACGGAAGETAPLSAVPQSAAATPPAGGPPEPVAVRLGLTRNAPGAAAGYTLLVPFDADTVYLLDALGRAAYSWEVPLGLDGFHFKLLENGNLLALLRQSGGGRRTLAEIAPDGRVAWQYSRRGLHHDFLKLPNGNVLLLAQGRKTPAEAIAAGANPEFVSPDGLDFDYLLEVQPVGLDGGEVVWQWSAWDHLVQDFDPAKPNYGAPADHPQRIDLNYGLAPLSHQNVRPASDWLHANSLDYHPELNRIMLTVRHFSELWMIDRRAAPAEAAGAGGSQGGQGGGLLYRWGNPRAYGRGGAGEQQLFWPHNAHWIPPGLPGAGNVLVFNNGAEFAGYERWYSSADELARPADGGGYRRESGPPWPPAGPVWSYAAPPPESWYAHIRSGAQRLPNGNTLIVDGTRGTIFQVTPAGERVWEYVNPILMDGTRLRQGDPMPVNYARPTPYGFESLWQNTIYRAYWYPPDYPGLQKLELPPAGPLLEQPSP